MERKEVACGFAHAANPLALAMLTSATNAATDLFCSQNCREYQRQKDLQMNANVRVMADTTVFTVADHVQEKHVATTTIFPA